VEPGNERHKALQMIRVTGFLRKPSYFRPGTQEGRGAIVPRPSIFSLNQAGEPPSPKPYGLAGDLSEVTALGIRHWTTSFRC
jgi:hypothetical protein